MKENLNTGLTNKEKFERYERVRKSGRFNMIMEASAAMRAADLSAEDYWDVIRNYEKYMNL